MSTSACCLALAAALVAGCATTSSNQDQDRWFSARDLGVEEQFSGGSLAIREVAPDVYNASFKILKTNIRPSGQDALLVKVIAARITVCPAWRLAKEKGAEAAVITKEMIFEGDVRFSIFPSFQGAVRCRVTHGAGVQPSGTAGSGMLG